MYLKGSRYSLKKRRRQRRTNPALVVLLLGAIGLVMYFERYVVDVIPLDQPLTPTVTREPEAIIREAEALFRDGNLYPAIEAYRQAILADPYNVDVHVELAKVQILAGEYEAAQTSAENALLLNPDSPMALAVYGWSLSFLDSPIEAEQAFRRSIELNPNNPYVYAFYAELLADEGDFIQAGDYSRLAMDLDPTLLEVRRARGYVLELAGEHEAALVQYQEALAVNDRIADLHLSIGRVYWALGLTQDAIDSFSTADSLDPGNPLPEAYISLIYLNVGEYGKAIQFAKRAVDDDPTNPRRYGAWGVSLYRNLQYQDAIQTFSFAVHGGTTEQGVVVVGLPLSPDVVEYFYMYGLALARTGGCGDALLIFRAILTNVPSDQIATFNAEEGIRICQEAVANPPTPISDEDDGGL